LGIGNVDTVWTWGGQSSTPPINSPESEDEEVENRRQSAIELERRKKELGIAGYYSSQAAFMGSSMFVGFIKNILKNAKMMINFVYYVLRMLGLGIWMILQLPRQLMQGLFAGLTDNGIIKENSRISKTVNDLSADLGLKQIFFDSLVELFQATSDSEEDLPGVTGMPSNRSQNAKQLSDADSHSCSEGNCKICDGSPKKSKMPKPSSESLRKSCSATSLKHLKDLSTWRDSLSSS